MVAWVVIDRQHLRQTSPSLFPCSHSHFGSHPSLIPEEIIPFFSCSYVEPILQPLCFQIHACNGGCTPSPTCHLQTFQRPACCHASSPAVDFPPHLVTNGDSERDRFSGPDHE